jgi:hypothetical protein
LFVGSYNTKRKKIMSKFITRKNNVSQPERAHIIARSLGIKAAAKYLKCRGWSVEAACVILLGA